MKRFRVHYYGLDRAWALAQHGRLGTNDLQIAPRHSPIPTYYAADGLKFDRGCRYEQHVISRARNGGLNSALTYDAVFTSQTLPGLGLQMPSLLADRRERQHTAISAGTWRAENRAEPVHTGRTSTDSSQSDPSAGFCFSATWIQAGTLHQALLGVHASRPWTSPVTLSPIFAAPAPAAINTTSHLPVFPRTC